MTTSTKKIKKKVWTSLGVWAAIAGLWAVSVAVTGIAAPAHADPYSDDGLSASVTPVKVRPNVSAVFTLTVTDLNSSGVQFDTYILTGLPQGWILRNGATRLNPISPDPIIYQFPAPDAWAGRITIEPPNGFTGTLSSVTVGRVKSSPNLIVDFDNGSFDYIGQAKPTLPSRNTNYGYHDPHQLYTVPPSCTSTQYGPCDGDYTIWPTANINGPQHQIYGHYNNYWADLRSISNPMTSPTTAEVCARWDEILSNGSATNTLQVTNSQSASSGKIAIFNGATDMPIPNDLVTTTVSGLVPNQAYVFNAYVANLSDDPRGGTRPVRTAAYVKKSDSDIGILIGSTQPLPVQAGCHTYNTGWVHSSAIVMTGSSGQLILSLRNYAAGGFGNDLAIDNLSLYPLATVPIEMTVAAAAPELLISKSADPASGSMVFAGQEITYTLTGKNSGDTDLRPVVLTDNLAGVLSHADYVVGSATALIDGNPVALPVLSGTTLTWSGTLTATQSVTVTYRVKVHSDVQPSDHLVNRLTGRGEDPDEPGTEVPGICIEGEEEECSTTHTPGVPGLLIAKTSDPTSGSTLRPGQTVTYTVTAVNTGNVVLDPVVVSDDLRKVLNHTSFVAGSLRATIDGLPTTMPYFTGSQLTWTGVLPVGKTVTLTYKVTVNMDVTSSDVLVNAVIGRGETPEDPGHDVPSNCVTGEEEGCYTTLTPIISKLEIYKESNPVSGSTVFAGQIITYTLHATNTGDIGLDPVILTDDMAGVLGHARFVPGSASAILDGTRVVAPALAGSTLTWIGPLAPG
ncbi:MAG: hypothetical protein FWD55_08500, partial [Propionibacteriaceae bacterium]|nr:hypothetical protein [Propionibacteriaceae bacterium]